jgi:hypothetical protein
VNLPDKLIIAGVVTVPLAGAIFFGIVCFQLLREADTDSSDLVVFLFITLFCLVVAIAAGLITAGILLRKRLPTPVDKQTRPSRASDP